MSDQGSAANRPKRTNERADRPARRRAQRDGHSTPDSIAWCLSNPGLTAKRFTPFQWMILELGWGQWSGYRTSEWVAATMDEDPAAVRQARADAEALAYELAYVWNPALRRWQDGKNLSRDDRRILDKHRKTKKGRRAVPGRLNPAPSTSPETVPFSEMPSSARRSHGVPESYNPDPRS